MSYIKIPVERIEKAWRAGMETPDDHEGGGVYLCLEILGIRPCYRCGDPDHPVDPDRLCSGCYRDGKNRGWTIYPVEES